MAIVIFFGGILLGFLLGFIGMALLSVMHYRLHCEELREAPVYQRLSPPQEG
jgi:hypothetical protein